MKKINLPGVSFPVSQICLGTAYLGSRENDDISFSIMDEYYEAGGRFMNTAHEYGDGRSERVIGKWLCSRGIRREEIAVTSKCGEDDSKTEFSAMSPDELFEDLDQSLCRTGFDYFDFYLLHIDDESIPVGEIVDVMDEMQRLGRIRYYGCSNWSVSRMEEASRWAADHDEQGFVLDEIEMNLMRLNVDNHKHHCKWLDGEYIGYHKKTGMPVGAYSPIANGLLCKYLRDGGTSAWKPHHVRTYENESNFETAEKIGRLSAETGLTPAQIQMAWHISQPYDFASFPIIGARNVSQLKDSLGCLGIELTPDMVRYLTPSYT